VSGRLSPTEALCLLMASGLSAHDAADRLNTGMRTNKCRLWCDGNVVPVAYIVTSLLVVARTKADDRWRADVVSGTREAWEKPAASYVFEFEADEVKALPPPTPEPQPEPPPAPEPEPEPEPEPKKVKRPRRRRAEKAEAAEGEASRGAPTPAPKQPTASRSRAQEAIRQFAARAFPHGTDGIELRDLIKAADDDKQFTQTVKPFPHREVFARALGRRPKRK
jgi:hypothetical protein